MQWTFKWTNERNDRQQIGSNYRWTKHPLNYSKQPHPNKKVRTNYRSKRAPKKTIRKQGRDYSTIQDTIQGPKTATTIGLYSASPRSHILRHTPLPTTDIITQSIRPPTRTFTPNRHIIIDNINSTTQRKSSIAKPNIMPNEQAIAQPDREQVERARPPHDGDEQQQKEKFHLAQQILTSNKPNNNNWWGNAMETWKPRTSRIFFQNINGIQFHSAKNRWSSVLEYIQLHQCNIVGLAETNTTWDKNIVKSIRQSARTKLGSTVLSVSNNATITDRKSLPGEALQMSVGHWSLRHQWNLNDDDRQGRWTGQQFRLKESRSLFVIAAYRSCKPNSMSEKTPLSTHEQQVTLSRQRGDQNPNPRLSFINDLMLHFTRWSVTQDDYIILMIDANEQLGKERNGINKLVEKLKLVDALSTFHKSQCKIPTYIQGSSRIDYIFVTRNVMPYIQ